MQVLILNWKDIKNPEVGGAEIILYEFAKRLIGDGHTVTWFCREFPGSIPKESCDGIDIIRKGNRFTVYLHAYYYYVSLKNKPDKVLDCLNTIAWQTPLYVPEEKRILYVNQLAKEVLFYELPPIISHISYAFEGLQFIPYRNTKTFCYAESVKNELISMGILEEKINLFPLGLDHERYKPGEKCDTPLFVFVARLVRMKRADLCVRATEYLLKKFPDLHLAIIGFGSQERVLQQYINRHHLDESIRIVNKNNLFFSKTPKDVKVKLLQQAWALILPSVKEGWGMVVTEAAACGTPSIVTDVTGLTDSVRTGETGIVVSKNPKPTEIADAMESVIANVKLRYRLSNNALKYSSTFSWEKSYARFLSLLSA